MISVVLVTIGFGIVRIGWPSRVLVTWETASEVDAAGFLVYRSDSPEGPFTRISDSPVLAKGDPLLGASYRYEDEDVAWGQRYFYQLEEVERDGTANRFPDVVEGQAGAGWPWALATGALLGGVGPLLTRYLVAATRHASEVT